MTLRSRPGLVSLRSRPEMDVTTWLELARLGLKSRHHFEVATWVVVGEVATWILVSRPRNPTVGRNEVAT